MDEERRKKATEYERPEMPWERKGMADPGRMGWATAGLEFAAAVGLCLAAGWWLDSTQGWHPWGKVAGAMLGVAAGMYRLIRRATRGDGDGGAA